MTGILIAACAAILLAGAGPLWQWRRARHRTTARNLPAGRASPGATALRAAASRRIAGRRTGGPAAPSTGPDLTGRWATPPPPPPVGSGPDLPPYTPAPGEAHRRSATGLGWLPVSGAVIAVGIAAAAVALSSGARPGHRHTPTADAHTSRGRGGAGSTPTVSAAPSPTTASPTTTSPAPSTTSPAPSTTAPASPSGGPVLSAVEPASAGPGQRVTLSGSGLFSPSGRIVVMFGSVQAAVSCPTQSVCQATVPPADGQGPSVAVKIITDAGTSPSVVFTYG